MRNLAPLLEIKKKILARLEELEQELNIINSAIMICEKQSGSLFQTALPPAPSPTVKTTDLSAMQAVRTIINALEANQTFNKNYIFEILKETHSQHRKLKPATLNIIMNRLQNELIEVVHQGKGRTPTTYKRKSHQESSS